LGAIFLSCESEELATAFRGRVILFNYQGNFMWGSMDGVKVKVQAGDLEYIEISDADGFFTFDNIPLGEYDITFEKEGFISFNSSSSVLIRRSEEDEFFYSEMLQIPTVELELLSIQGNRIRWLGAYIRTGNGPPERIALDVQFFVSKTPDVSNTNYDLISRTDIIAVDSRPWIESAVIHIQEDNQPKYNPMEVTEYLNSADTLYFVVYPLTKVRLPESSEDIIAYGKKSNAVPYVLP